uniref:HSF-type DNA-binding domain-containing protein n=1 Tax=Bactrocera dorsalis TaxID=27457 RepID=A0A034WC24_BACDO
MQNNVEFLSSAMECTQELSSFVTRQDILNFPFPYKLWLIVHLDYCDFLRWNRDGTVILLDLIALEDYLNSTQSIFKIKNRSVFLEHLEQFKFDRLNAMPEADEDLLLQYRNENFQRHRLDLLAKIRRHTYQLLGEMDQKNKTDVETTNQLQRMAEENKYRQVADRMLGDLCFMSHGGLSNIQKSRLRFQTVLSFQNETRILEDKLRASDECAAIQAQQRRIKSDVTSRSGNGLVEEEQVIELPVDLFENPHDSVLHLGEDFRPEYAGYYGNCSKEQVLHFFGDYLPMYEDGSMEIKKIVAEICTANQQAILSTEESFGDQIHVGDQDGTLTSSTTPSCIGHQILPTLNLSSTLEPIFKNDEDDDVNHSLSKSEDNLNICAMGDSEAEISMDEFIKFKENIKEDMKVSYGENLKDFPQMPTAIKMEITDESDSENEANFRNFFSQYRASLNLLYERH